MNCLLFTVCELCSVGILTRGTARCCVNVSPPVLTEEEASKVPSEMKVMTPTGFSVLRLKEKACPYYTSTGCSLSPDERFLECRLFPVVPYDRETVLLYYGCAAIIDVFSNPEAIKQMVGLAKEMLKDVSDKWVQAVRSLNKVDEYKIKLLVRL